MEHYNGWADRRVIDFFLRYCEAVFKEYKGLVKYWLTFNEINMLTMPFGSLLAGGGLPQEEETAFDLSGTIPDDPQVRYQALHHQFVASALAVAAAHKIDPACKVGCMIAGMAQYPYTPRPEDVLEAQRQMRQGNYLCGDVQVRGAYPSFAKRMFEELGVKPVLLEGDGEILKNGKVDFYSFSYYATGCVSADPAERAAANFIMGIKNPYLAASEWGWTIDPKGLRYFLNELYGRYGIPLMVVENGLGASDELTPEGTVHDPYRIEYLRQHILEMGEAIRDGVDLMGYTLWGCIDIVSASTGEMKKRYGVIYVDRDDEGKGTLRRYKKDSFFWYQRCIASNGTELD
jgi:6-phospho-beta-glucosidase